MHLNFDRNNCTVTVSSNVTITANLCDAGRSDRDGDAVSGDNYDRAGSVGSGSCGCVARRRDADRVDRSHERKLHLGSDGSEQWRGDDQYSCGNSTRRHRFAQGDVHAGFGELHCVRNVVRHWLGEGEPSVAPAVTVTPSPATITTAQTLSVTIAVAAPAGGATPTGSVVLTSGSYTSAAATLSGGSATISVPAGTLPTGTDSLKATYTPDSGSSTTYLTSSGTGSVTVNPLVAPTVTVTPSPTSVTTAQTLSVTVAVAASPGGATPTGSVVLTSGSYTSAATTLSSGSATISVPAGSLALGTDSLKATYTPDSASSTAVPDVLRHRLGDGHPAATDDNSRPVLIEHHNDSIADGDH